MQPDQTRETFRDYRWGTDCPIHLLRHWCIPCRGGEVDHPGSHTCNCGATDVEDPGFDAWLHQVNADMEASVRAALDARTCCSPEASAPLLRHLGEQLEVHADRDGLTGVRRAVFHARGGHAPGDACPSEPPTELDPHQYWCGSPDEPCRCGVSD